MQISAANTYSLPSLLNARSAENSRTAGHQGGKSGELTPDEQAQVDKLKARDRQVRAHEQAHLAAAGGMAVSGASFTYQRGPDGVSYAIGGEVSISTSEGRTPEETLRRAEQVRAAALAPADPSGQDRAVAAAAGQMAQQARAEMAQQSMAESNGTDNADNRQQQKIAAFYGSAPASPSSRISAYA